MGIIGKDYEGKFSIMMKTIITCQIIKADYSSIIYYYLISL